jgi:replicative DNA helicase
MDSDIRSPFSQEAEQSVLGAMLIRPELIDALSADILESDFYFAENKAAYRAIMDLKSRNVAVDFLTLADAIDTMPDGQSALAYCTNLQRNTPSAANAGVYARIVHERAIDRSLIAAAQRIHEIAHSSISTQDKVSAAQSEVLGVDGESATPETIHAWDVMATHIDELERRFRLGGRMDGLPTGIKTLDDHLCGMKPEQLWVIAGRPKMGKTTFAMGIARENAIRGKKSVLVVSLEMSNGQLIDRLIAAEGTVPLNGIKSGEALGTHSDQITFAAGQIKQSKLTLSDRPGLTISRIRTMARRHKMVHGLDLLLIDHIGLLDGEDRQMNQIAKVSEITRQAKLMAKELKIPVVILSQLNRSLEQRPNKRPVPSDLRDSGTIEQDADVVLFVYRDEVYNPDTEHKGVAEIIIGLGRDVETGTFYTEFQGQYNRFADLAPGRRVEQSMDTPKVVRIRGMQI